MNLTIKNSIINRKVDFWILGGLSVVVWVFVYLGSSFKSTPLFSLTFSLIVSLFTLFTVLVNQPHFLISYWFAYRQGKVFIVQHWFILIILPMFMFSLFLLAYCFFNQYGSLLLGMAVVVLNITVSWHYAKQVYGCMISYSVLDHYPLSLIQRSVIRINLLSLAFLNYFINEKFFRMLARDSQNFLGIPLIQINAPPIVITLSWIILELSFLSVLVMVFYKNYRDLKIKPSFNFLIPWVAFYIWWLPLSRQNEFYFIMVPFFHSLQYLTFGIKREKYERPNKSFKYILFSLISIGVLFLQLIPRILDVSLNTESKFKTAFFLASIGIFLNIHHFFIDSVVWRAKNFKVKDVANEPIKP